MTATWDQLRATARRVLAMSEPRCACGHVLTAHSRRRVICYARRFCGCQGWTPRAGVAPC